MNLRPYISFEGDVREYRPFEELRGTVTWEFERLPTTLELRLFWFTRGRGTEEAGIVATKAIPVSRSGSEAFVFELPDRPYSFAGSLITIAWAVELVSDPDGSLGYQEFTLSPTGKQLSGIRIPRPRTVLWWERLQYRGK